jgi:hypothetical protein
VNLGLIDSASLMNAVEALTLCDNHSEWGDWTKRSVFDVTNGLAFHKYLGIFPGLSQSQSAPPPYSNLYRYDLAIERLGNIDDIYVNTSDLASVQKASKKKYKKWVLSNIKEAKNIINITKENPDFRRWEQRAVRNSFVDHSMRLNGLFNLEMTPELSLILNIDEKDLKTLWVKTKDYNQLRAWSSGKQHDSDFEAARDAYVVSAILRGRYHDAVYNKLDWWKTHHPIRDNVLPPTSEATGYRISEALCHLNAIIISSAMEEKRSQARIETWAENLITLRNASTSDEIKNLMTSDVEGNKAIDLAIKKAKELRLRVYPKSLSKLLDGVVVGVSSVIGGSPWYIAIHEPWLATGLSITGTALGAAASYYGLVRTSLGLRFTEKLFLTDKHFYALANLRPGRISWIWGGTKKQSPKPQI